MLASPHMTYTFLDEEFTAEELYDIAQHGANTGVHGFTYSSDLRDKYEANEDEILDVLADFDITPSKAFEEHDFETLQQFREYACWVYLEVKAAHMTDCD